MSFANYPTLRSSSLPSPSEFNDFYKQPTYPAQYARDGGYIASEAPITPPMSPGRSEEDDNGIAVDPEPRYSGHEYGAPAYSGHYWHPAAAPQINTNTAQSNQQSQPMEEDYTPSPDSPHPRVRLLEEEECHAERGGEGGLRLTDFDIKGTLGTGTFGRVLLVQHRNGPRTSPGNIFALKVLRKSDLIRLKQVEHVNAERYILSRVRHPFIVDLYATFQDSLNIYMLLSYVPGGELFTHLRRAQRFTPDVTRFYLATIVLALKYLHSFNIVYRDLKPENLLLDNFGYLRLTDFGFAKIVDDRTWTLCGTPEYLAPEIIQSDGHGKAADWWACGILAYEMMVGYPPFFDESPYGIYEKILKGKIYWPKDMDKLSKDLIKAFLHPDRSKRLGNLIGGAQDVLDHPWFRGVDWDALERREIRAPIIPHVTSVDDMRHFSRLPLPPADEIPGLIREEPRPSLQNGFNVIDYHFLEF